METIEIAKKITQEAIERFEADMGSKPSLFQLERLLGGDGRHWGRILKGVAVARGPYLAKLKILKEHGSDAAYVLACAEKSNRYGHNNRKGNLVVHSSNIYNDRQEFYEGRIFDGDIQDIHFDDPYDYQEFCLEHLERFHSEGPHRPESFEEEMELRRDFFESL